MRSKSRLAVVFERCNVFEEHAASFVLGDLAGDVRADMVAHLDTCGSCRREMSALTDVVDSISAVTVPVDPGPGFVDAVLEAAAGVNAAVGDHGRGPVEVPSPMPQVALVQRPIAVVRRRRRTILTLTGAAMLLTVLASESASWALGGLAIFMVALEATYVGLVVAVTHSKARDELATAFAEDECWWRGFEPILTSSADADSELVATPVVAVDNVDLARFLCSFFAGWFLTPLVALIRLIRGDLAGIEASSVLGPIVALQRRGRAQSLRLLAAGATTVAVAGAGGAATIWIAPGIASAATPAHVHTFGPQTPPEALADRHGTWVSNLGSLNRDPPPDPDPLSPDHDEP